MEKVLTKENPLKIVLENNKGALDVELGWDAKDGSIKERLKGRIEEAAMGVSARAYDLNLAAILHYSDGTKAELVCHEGASGQGFDAAGSVKLGRDDRTGYGEGSDESIHIELSKVPEAVDRIVLFMDIHGANAVDQCLTDVENVFVQVQDAEDRRVYLREEDAFKAECAEHYCCYTFASLVREGESWVLQGEARYSLEDNVYDTLKAFE